MKYKFIILVLFNLHYHSAVARQMGVAIGSSPFTSIALEFFGEEWGGEFGVMFSSEINDKAFLDYSIPHSMYDNIGKKRLNNAYMIGVSRGFLSEYGPYFNVSLGMIMISYVDIVRSQATGLLYANGKTNSIEVPVGIGVTFPIPDTNEKRIGVSFDSYRGIRGIFSWPTN